MRARTVLFLKGISATIFSLRSCTACARALGAVHALARAARGAARDDGSCSPALGGSAAKWTNVVWPIKRRQTNQQTNKHTLLFYRYRYIYVLLTKHPGNTVQYMPERRSHEGMYRVRYCPRARSITHLLHARLGYEHFFHSFFVFFLFSGSKSGPYCVILDRLSGQYREIWTGLGCRGLANCMTTVTCRVINIYTSFYMSLRH